VLGDDAKVLAGGQSLMPMLALRLARPAALVDINRVAGLDTIRVDDGLLRLGALARQRNVERWAAERCPLLAAGLRLVGHTAIRTRGTVAGSIAHADPASELPALLLCLDGAVAAQSRDGTRDIPASEFFVGPLTTVLRSDELVTETRWRLPLAETGWGFHEIARRHGDFALAGVAALLTLGAGQIQNARVALFGVGPSALRARGAEARLTGEAPSDAVFRDAAAIAAAEIDPAGDLHASAAYRRRVAETLIVRALADARSRTKDLR